VTLDFPPPAINWISIHKDAVMTTMVYNSDNFVVVELDVPVAPREGDTLEASDTPLSRGGYEIVDKFARKEIYIEGALAQQFREGVEELARNEPTQDQVEEFIGRYTGLAQQPLILH
jgi:transcriptional regulator of nitric oxide reductase